MKSTVSKTGSHLYKNKEQICQTFSSVQLALNRKTHNTLDGLATSICALREDVCKQFHKVEAFTATTGGVSFIPFIAGTIKQLQRSLLLLLVR